MSRRCHHGSPRHAHQGRERRRPGSPDGDRRQISSEPRAFESQGPAPQAPERPQPSLPPRPRSPEPQPRAIPAEPTTASAAAEAPASPVAPARPVPAPQVATEPTAFAGAGPDEPRPDNGAATIAREPDPATPAAQPAPMRPLMQRPTIPRPPAAGPPDVRPVPVGEDGGLERTATAPQLRRFIKSRAYVPMHELRRRFAINGADDEVTSVDLERHRVFVGLPEREGRLLGELLRGGDIGYELSLDPITPIVVGVYPMRPVTRA